MLTENDGVIMVGAMRQRAAAFVDRILSIIEQDQNFDSALGLSEWLACYLCENSTGVYRCDRLEEILYEKLDVSIVPYPEAVATEVELHVASMIYRSGGHTPLMRSLIQEGHRAVKVLLTRMTDASEGADILGVNPNQVVTIPKHLSARDRINFLAQEFLKFSDVVLHVHPDDVLCAVAIRVAKRVRPEIRISLVNHADHVFSVGHGIADHIFEVSTYGWLLRERRGSIGRSSFIGIPIARPLREGPPSTSGSNEKYILTGGASYKFKPMGELSLPHALSRVLVAIPDLRLTVIGAGSRDWWWWGLRLRFGKRVRLIKTIPKEQYLRYLHGATLYVDSFPWLGGTAFPEALILGRHIAGLLGVAWGYSAADELRSGNEDEFVESCLALTRLDHAAIVRQHDVRLKCVENHDPAKVRSRMDEALKFGLTVLPPQEQLKNPPIPKIEELWEKSAISNLPSKRRGNLSSSVRRQIALAHASTMGWMDRASIKLLYYGFLE